MPVTVLRSEFSHALLSFTQRYEVGPTSYHPFSKVNEGRKAQKGEVPFQGHV